MVRRNCFQTFLCFLKWVIYSFGFGLRVFYLIILYIWYYKLHDFLYYILVLATAPVVNDEKPLYVEEPSEVLQGVQLELIGKNIT